MKNTGINLMLTLAGAGILLEAGCLERKENITITPKGEVTIRLEYSGSKDDWKTADAMPDAKAGWDMKKSVKTEGEKEEEIQTAERTFAPGAELPRRFAAEGDPNADCALDFPTSLRREQRADGVYYHFRRAYAARPWSAVHYLDDIIFDDSIKKLGEKKTEDLTAEERTQMVRAFILLETMKETEYARAAVLQGDREIAPDHWLKARRALLHEYEKTDFHTMAEAMEELSEEDRNDRMEQETHRLIEQSHRSLLEALRGAGYPAERIERFEKAYERVKRRYRVTEELGGQSFEVRVTMPGEIIEHNSEKSEGGDTVTWEFRGEAFRDRSLELLVTSRVPPDEKPE